MEDVQRMLRIVWTFAKNGLAYTQYIQHTTFLTIKKGLQHGKRSEIFKNFYASHFGKGYRLLPMYHFQCTGPIKPDLKSWIFWKVYYWTVNLYYGCYFFQYLKGMVSTARVSASGMVNLYFWILAGEGHKHRFLISAKKRFFNCGTTVQFLHLLLNHSHLTLLSSSYTFVSVGRNQIC